MNYDPLKKSSHKLCLWNPLYICHCHGLFCPMGDTQFSRTVGKIKEWWSDYKELIVIMFDIIWVSILAFLLGRLTG